MENLRRDWVNAHNGWLDCVAMRSVAVYCDVIDIGWMGGDSWRWADALRPFGRWSHFDGVVRSGVHCADHRDYCLPSKGGLVAVVVFVVMYFGVETRRSRVAVGVVGEEAVW